MSSFPLPTFMLGFGAVVAFILVVTFILLCHYFFLQRQLAEARCLERELRRRNSALGLLDARYSALEALTLLWRLKNLP